MSSEDLVQPLVSSSPPDDDFLETDEGLLLITTAPLAFLAVLFLLLIEGQCDFPILAISVVVILSVGALLPLAIREELGRKSATLIPVLGGTAVLLVYLNGTVLMCENCADEVLGVGLGVMLMADSLTVLVSVMVGVRRLVED